MASVILGIQKMVLNKHKCGIPAGAIYIGRGSIWGNPYVMGKDGDRDAVCEAHKQYLWDQIQSGQVSLDSLAALHGKVLVCFCAPLRCHGDTLIKAAAWAVQQLEVNDNSS